MSLAFIRSKATNIAALLAIALALPSAAWAALGTATIWEVQVGGSNSANGGGFDPGNASMATDLAATSGNTASPVVTSASYNFIARDVNAWLFVKSGTNWTPGWYKIASVSANAATLTAGVATANLYKGQSLQNTSAGCASVASPTAGTWSIDYTQQTSPGITYVDMVIDGTTNTKYTSSGFPVGVNIVGNCISVTSGTGFTVQYVQIVSVSGTTATCDKSLGTLSSTAGHGGLGGALATHVQAFTLMTGANGLFIKYSATPYTISGGSINMTGTAGNNFVVGYNTTRGVMNTDSSLPTIRMGAGGTRAMYVLSTGTHVRNLIFDNPSAFGSSCKGIQTDGQVIVSHCKFTALDYGIYNGGAQSVIVDCYAESCTTAGFAVSNNAHFTNCVAKSCAASFQSGSTFVIYTRCISIGHTGASPAFNPGAGSRLVGCIAYAPTHATTDGFGFSTQNPIYMENCVAVNCTAYGFNQAGNAEQGNILVNCAGYNNTTADVNTTDYTSQNTINFIHLTGDPFVSASGGNFALNATAGAGAALSATGFPASFLGISTLSYPDIGAAQHANPAGGGLIVNPGTTGGLRSVMPPKPSKSLPLKKAG